MREKVTKIFLNTFLVMSVCMGLNAQPLNYKKLGGEIQLIQKQLVPDKRVAILEVSLEDTLQSTIILNGKTNFPEGKIRITELLKEKGILFVDSFRILPERVLGDKTWGLTTLSVSNMRAQPSHAAELVSQALMGTPLKVLEYNNGWYRVQTPDYYIGWMEDSGLERFNADEINRWKKADRYVFNRVSGNAFDSPGRRKMAVTDLVLGDLFEVEGEKKGFLKIRMPDGRTAFVQKAECLSWNEWTSRKPDAQSLILVARQLLGLPYTWGGTSCKTVDCSGLSKTAYFSQGIILARDASQQAKYGEHPDFNNIGNLQPGDLLFFGRNAQRVTHVAVYMGNGKYIHASGLVRINSINPDDPEFSEALRKKLVATSRVLNSLNTEGIVLVKDHPWYSVVNQ